MNNSNFSSVVIKLSGTVLVSLILILMVVYSIHQSATVFESPILLAILNTLFICIFSLVVANMSARSYRATGIHAFLIAGCGFVIFGVSNLYAGWVMPLAGNPNPTVTLHNLGSFFAGLCQFVAAHYFLQELASFSKTSSNTQKLRFAYAAIIILVSITAWLSFQETLPAFFDPVLGPSLLRQLVLGAAISLFAIAGLAFMEIYTTIKTEFAYWYGLALILIAIGLTCVFLQSSVGSLIGWIGRGAQYLGSIYFLVAFYFGHRELPDTNSSETTRKNWTLWPFLEERISERTEALVKINKALQTEISVRKQTEKALQESEERFRAIAAHTPDHIIKHDLQLRYTMVVNPQLGLSEQDMIGKTDYDFLSMEEAEKLTKTKNRVLESGKSAHFETSLNTLNGELEYFDGTFVPTLDPQGQVDGLIGYFRNVTEQKQSAAALKKSEWGFRSLFENMLEGFAFCKLLYQDDKPYDFIYIDVNRAFEQLTGLAQVVGKKVSEVIPGLQDSNPELFEIYGRVSQTGNPEQFETFLEELDIWLLISVYSNEKDYFIAVFDNITKRKRADIEIRQLNEMLEQRVAERTAELVIKNRELESFSYSISHDLRAPLRAISGFAEIITNYHRADLNPQAQHYFDNIVVASNRMNELINDLLTYSRLGSHTVNLAPIQLEELLMVAINDLADKITALQATITIDPNLSNVCVVGNTSLLRRGLINLLENALIFHQPGNLPHITIACQCNAGQVELCITDNGIGIPSEYQDKIFNVFQRLHSEKEYPGTGIGLAIVKKTIEMQGGSVRVKSEVGKGSTFIMNLSEAI